MRDDGAAVRAAVDLMHVPSRVRAQRSQPLPAGTAQLLRIVVGDANALAEAAAQIERPQQLVKEAAGFFIEQVLLCPGADSYRVLGARRGASNEELRRNLALLLKWVHPDLDPLGSRSLFVARVTGAWDDLKVTERRRAYDAQLDAAAAVAAAVAAVAAASTATGTRAHGKRRQGKLYRYKKIRRNEHTTSAYPGHSAPSGLGTATRLLRFSPASRPSFLRRMFHVLFSRS